MSSPSEIFFHAVFFSGLLSDSDNVLDRAAITCLVGTGEALLGSPVFFVSNFMISERESELVRGFSGAAPHPSQPGLLLGGLLTGSFVLFSTSSESLFLSFWLSLPFFSVLPTEAGVSRGRASLTGEIF